MNKILAVALSIALAGCDAPFWVKQTREDQQIARQEAIRAREKETWRAEESRRLLALCLDIAKFEKQWNNFAAWSFDAQTGECSVSYKKPATDKKTEKECADLWLGGEGERVGDGPSGTASSGKQRLYYSCVAETFSREWNVLTTETSP